MMVADAPDRCLENMLPRFLPPIYYIIIPNTFNIGVGSTVECW